MSARPAAQGPRTAALLERVELLEQALGRGGDRVPELTAQGVRSALAGVRERLALGVDHTVVALVGGTGSGKSSVFNALAGLTFADVGVKRPTTSQVTACMWAHDASALLDWLGVARDRRLERESELDGESQADLRGLVLLDLPDHDSIEPEHRAVVDRLLPLVDLLVWVVDPQKYADDALHSGYLRHLVGHEGAMLVVLNQIDTVPVDSQASLLRDVSRLLREDGLTEVGVHSVSARTGDGIPVVRGVLARAVGGRGIAEVRASAELDDAARAVHATVGPSEAESPDEPRRAALEELGEAVGLPGILSAVDRALRGGTSPEGLRLGPAQADRVALVRERWLAAVGGPLPAPWREALDGSVPDAARLAEVADERAAAVQVRGGPSTGAVALRLVAALSGVVGLVSLGMLLGELLGEGTWSTRATAMAGVVAGALVLSLALLRWSTVLRGAAARRRVAGLDAEARAALGAVVDEVLVAPSASVLDDHRVVREASTVVVPSPGRHQQGSPTT